MHVRRILEDMGLETGSKGLEAPVVKERAEEHSEEDEEEMNKEEASRSRAIAARANYLGIDRPDLQYAVKEACRSMAAPKQGCWAKLKRLARYLLNPAWARAGIQAATAGDLRRAITWRHSVDRGVGVRAPSGGCAADRLGAMATRRVRLARLRCVVIGRPPAKPAAGHACCFPRHTIFRPRAGAWSWSSHRRRHPLGPRPRPLGCVSGPAATSGKDRPLADPGCRLRVRVGGVPHHG